MLLPTLEHSLPWAVPLSRVWQGSSPVLPATLLDPPLLPILSSNLAGLACHFKLARFIDNLEHFYNFVILRNCWFRCLKTNFVLATIWEKLLTLCSYNQNLWKCIIKFFNYRNRFGELIYTVNMHWFLKPTTFCAATFQTRLQSQGPQNNHIIWMKMSTNRENDFISAAVNCYMWVVDPWEMLL